MAHGKNALDGIDLILLSPDLPIPWPAVQPPMDDVVRFAGLALGY